jgi:hypothetical protein
MLFKVLGFTDVIEFKGWREEAELGPQGSRAGGASWRGLRSRGIRGSYDLEPRDKGPQRRGDQLEVGLRVHITKMRLLNPPV